MNGLCSEYLITTRNYCDSVEHVCLYVPNAMGYITVLCLNSCIRYYTPCMKTILYFIIWTKCFPPFSLLYDLHINTTRLNGQLNLGISFANGQKVCGRSKFPMLEDTWARQPLPRPRVPTRHDVQDSQETLKQKRTVQYVKDDCL